MKRIIALAAIAAFVACNGGQTKTTTADSSKSAVDTSKVTDTSKTAVDTTKKADTAKKAADTTHKMKKMKM
jgi:hypothetical protein